MLDIKRIDILRFLLEKPEIGKATLILTHPSSAEPCKFFVVQAAAMLHLARPRLPLLPRVEDLDPLRDWIASDAVTASLVRVLVDLAV